jgi:hypothetical protein
MSEEKLKIKNTRTIIVLFIPALLGIVATYLQVQFNVSLTPRELLLIQAVQFIASLWFGWGVSYLFSAATFHEQQRKFAISAYRRINEIEYALDRLLHRTKPKQGLSKNVNAELDAINEMAISLRNTVISSKADWADIIGDEIRAVESIKQPERSEQRTTGSIDRVENLEKIMASLPVSLEIQARQNLEDQRQEWSDIFRHDIAKKGYLELEGFWDQSFDRDAWELSPGEAVLISIDDAEDRVGALIAHDSEGRKIGVIINPTSGLPYHEFQEALFDATRKSKFQAIYAKKGTLLAADEGDDEGDRHYFDVQIKL